VKKFFPALLGLILSVTALSGCGTTPADETSLRLGALTGPTAMGMVQLLDGRDDGYAPLVCGSADELVPLLLQGELDAAALPVNLAAALYSKTGGELRAAAVTVLGVLNLCELGGDTLTSPAALRGQTLYATGKGSMPEVYLRYVLQQSGLDPDRDMNVEWKSEPAEIVALLKNAGHAFCLLPQPFASAAEMQLGEGLHASLSLGELWEEYAGETGCVTACLAVRADYAGAHPEQVKKLLEDCAASVQWVTEAPADAALVCEELGIVKASVAEKALPRCGLVCLTGEEMRQALEPCLRIIYEFSPAMIGGACPGEEFFYEG